MGMITNVLREDDSSTAYTYDFLDRLTSETRMEGDATVGAAYAYDAAGNRTAKITDKAAVTYDLPYGAEGNRLAGWQAALSNDYRTAVGVTGWATETIGTHPWLGQLYVSNAVALVTPAVSGTNFSVAAMPLGLGANELVAAIGDEAGNVDYASATVTVSVVTNAAYAYDAAGCLTNVSYHAAGVESRTALAWNSRYELTTVRTNGTIAETYQYDPLGRRVTISDGSTTNWFVYDGPHVIAETTASGTLTKSYVYGPGIDNALSMTVYSPTTNTYYYLTDHLGTVHALANTNGAIVESYKYDAWGRVLGVYDGNGSPLAESAIGNRILWQGREYSWKTGLYYFRARWYDPVTGRWLSNDPIGISGGLNQYVFCGNNPVNFRDPFGLEERSGTEELSKLRSTYGNSLIHNHLQLYQNHKGGGRFDYKVTALGDTFVLPGQTLANDQFGNYTAGYSAGYAGSLVPVGGVGVYPSTLAMVNAAGSVFGIADSLVTGNWNASQLIFMGDDWGSYSQIMAGYFAGLHDRILGPTQTSEEPNSQPTNK